MHTSNFHGVTFQFNSDLSGEVILRVGSDELRVPAEALVDFVAEHVRSERIAALEQASTNDVLGLTRRR